MKPGAVAEVTGGAPFHRGVNLLDVVRHSADQTRRTIFRRSRNSKRLPWV
jgi:hypothetical protein